MKKYEITYIAKQNAKTDFENGTREHEVDYENAEYIVTYDEAYKREKAKV